jgi:hypothetical protein
MAILALGMSEGYAVSEGEDYRQISFNPSSAHRQQDWFRHFIRHRRRGRRATGEFTSRSFRLAIPDMGPLHGDFGSEQFFFRKRIANSVQSNSFSEKESRVAGPSSSSSLAIR